MEYGLYQKINNDPKMHDFLINNSYWYKYLNRNSNNYKAFVDAYKSDKRNKRTNKVTQTIDTLDTVNSVLKILK